MYDTPKAAHFQALRDGQPLSRSDPVGLRYRWAVANKLQDLDMVFLSPDGQKKIAETLASTNLALKSRGITIELAEGYRGLAE